MNSNRLKTPKKPVSKLKFAVKDPIEVYCRIRPLENEFDQRCLQAKDDKTIILFSPDASQNARTRELHYTFKHVFDEKTSQKELFDHAALPLIQDLLSGSNGLLFTYGITSSGKTYTMTGNPQDGGLLPRSLDVIFNSISGYQAKKYVFKSDFLNGFDIQSAVEALQEQAKHRIVSSKTHRTKNKTNIGEWSTRVLDSTVVSGVNPDVNYAVFVSYVEIYNNYIYDLLDESSLDSKNSSNLNSKQLREDSRNNMYVFGTTQAEVTTIEEALELFYRGQQRKTVSHTALNTESSRSHSVFTIRVVQAPLDPQGADVLLDKNQMIISQLSLVDLAGSERPLRTQNRGQKLREAGNINTSLMVLRSCIEQLREIQAQRSTHMVKYRESKLTHLFKSFFEGEGKMRMIVCVNPHADDFDEINHVMRFSEMTQEVLIARSTPVKTNIASSLRSGRGNLYREAIMKAREQGVPITEVLAPAVYSLGPEFPQFEIHSSEDETVYINLIEFLLGRLARRNTFTQDLIRRQDNFRRNLIAVDKENVQLKQERTILQMDLDGREQQVQNLERKLSSCEQTLETLRKQLTDLEAGKENAMIELNCKARQLSEQTKEVERIKNKMEEKLASEKDRLRRIMEWRLANKQAELERKMCFTDDKFRLLREILNADDWEYFGVDVPLQPPSLPATTTSLVSVPEAVLSRKATNNSSAVTSLVTVPKAVFSRRATTNSAGEPLVETQFTKAKSAVDFVGGSNRQNIPSASHAGGSNRQIIPFARNKPLSTMQGNVAVANPRHRRSRSSSGEVWIEHKPVGNLELNTVLQPTMKKKKSVSKLEVKDIIKSDVSKYVLQHQEQDSQGEVETQLYKADVIPSAGGGAQVIFNDVEKLKQVSPPPNYNLRKRSSDNLPLSEIGDRCAVECHGVPSKMKKKN